MRLSGLRTQHCLSEDVGLIPGLTQWVKDLVAKSQIIGHRCSPDPELLWRWCRLAAAALIQPLAWEPPYARGCSPKIQKEKKKTQLKNL